MDLPNEVLARQWESWDRRQAEQKLAAQQRELTLAAYRHDYVRMKNLQIKIVRDLDNKCLAVDHVVRNKGMPGVDGVRWRTPDEMMRSAISLTSKGFHASPLRQIVIQPKNGGHERRPKIAVYYDKAMSVLYKYSLQPVTEAWADRKSFAFRPVRSAIDAHAYVIEGLKGSDAPMYVVSADVRGCYSHIHHPWLMGNAPMDKYVLSELLNAGIVMAGQLFPPEDEGISEASSLSPTLANFTLDGLQKHIYRSLYGTEHPSDYRNGNMVRFADDIVVNARSRGAAEDIFGAMEEFLKVRGLSISEEKSRICRVDEGFVFMSHQYEKINGIVYSYPTERAVDRIIDEAKELIEAKRLSQRELIKALNMKLTKWAAYHRYTDAEQAFRRVDAAVKTALLDAACAMHPKMPLAKVQAKYWYRGVDGRNYYTLEDDKTVYLEFLQDTLLIVPDKMKTNLNPFRDTEYLEAREKNRAIQHVTGTYKAVWRRQRGLCHYCGRPILGDDQKTIVPLDLREPPSARNSAFIHKLCEPNTFEVYTVLDAASMLRPYDIMQVLEGITTSSNSGGKTKRSITPEWKFYPLKAFFAKSTSPSITLTFRELERHMGMKLSPAAKRDKAWWYPRKDYNRIAEAWITEGYALHALDLEKEKVTFKRAVDNVGRPKIPKIFLEGNIPVDAVFELEHTFTYIMTKYGISDIR